MTLSDVLLAFGPQGTQASIESLWLVLNVPSGQSTHRPISLVWFTDDNKSLGSFSGSSLYIPGLHGSHSLVV